jgi:hypothetical protein
MPPSAIQTWDDMFEALCRFKEKYGHCDVNQRIEPWMKLGEWVNAQRRRKRRAGEFAPEQLRKLEAIGFKW